MKMTIFQKGFNYSQDGQGNRLVYHLQGCNMRCRWCSNPEGLEFESEHSRTFNNKDIVNEILNSKLMFFDGGGATFTGGEATCQYESLQEVLKELKENGISTCIETNGTSLKLVELMPYIDYLIMDIKHYDNEIHKKFTGVSNEIILKNLKQINKNYKNIHIRVPIIHGFNDDLKFVGGFLELFKELDLSNVTFEILAYHEYGLNKWNDLELEYEMKNGFVEDNTLKYFEEQFKKNGLKVIKT